MKYCSESVNSTVRELLCMKAGDSTEFQDVIIFKSNNNLYRMKHTTQDPVFFSCNSEKLPRILSFIEENCRIPYRDSDDF
jgi:hypothetical protein